MRQLSENEAWLRLTALCAAAEHCTAEIEEKLRKWGVEETARARIIARLIEGRYVDDERYCRAYVRDKIQYGKWGRRKIAQGLYMKHIGSDTATAVLDEVDDNDYLKVLRPLLKAKRRTVRGESDYERNGKLIRYALSRGYTFDLIRQCLEGGYDDWQADNDSYGDGDDD